ncbi:MAG: DNA cytosine methyltransferase [bacterium]
MWHKVECIGLNNDKQTVAEFFAGIGLMRMGLEQAGWQVVWANDIDEDKMKMYRGHYSDDDAHFHLGDVHALAPSDIPEVVLATASFPCNDLSLAGARLRGRCLYNQCGVVCTAEQAAAVSGR